MVQLPVQSNAPSLTPACGLQVALPVIQSTHAGAVFAQPMMVSLPLILQPDCSLAAPAKMVAPDCPAAPQASHGSSTSSVSTADTTSSTLINDMAVLNSCQLNIKSIQCAQGLYDAIEQVENGAVGRLCECYGPKDGRATDEMWGRLKGKIMKCERLYALLTGVFGGDKASFFEYFTISATSKPVTNMKQCSGKRGHCEGGRKLVALQLVVEAIPHCQKDLEDERKGARYIDAATGQFSVELWRAVWGCQNDWYVWRALGKEQYGSKKAHPCN
jgi:hypothetical protein